MYKNRNLNKILKATSLTLIADEDGYVTLSPLSLEYWNELKSYGAFATAGTGMQLEYPSLSRSYLDSHPVASRDYHVPFAL